MSSSASPAQPPCYHPPPPTISDSHKYHEGGILAITKNYAVENSSHSGLRECPRDHQCDSKRSLTVKVPLGDEVRLKAARILIKSSIKSSHPYRKFADGGKFYIVVDGSNKKNKKREKERKDCTI